MLGFGAWLSRTINQSSGQIWWFELGLWIMWADEITFCSGVKAVVDASCGWGWAAIYISRLCVWSQAERFCLMSSRIWNHFIRFFVRILPYVWTSVFLCVCTSVCQFAECLYVYDCTSARLFVWTFVRPCVCVSVPLHISLHEQHMYSLFCPSWHAHVHLQRNMRIFSIYNVRVYV